MAIPIRIFIDTSVLFSAFYSSKGHARDLLRYSARGEVLIVVAAAISASVDYLVTFDRKHLINPPIVRHQSQLTIVTPSEIISKILRGKG